MMELKIQKYLSYLIDCFPYPISWSYAHGILKRHFRDMDFTWVFLKFVISLIISCRAGLVEVYSFRLLLSGKVFIWPSILIESLAG